MTPQPNRADVVERLVDGMLAGARVAGGSSDFSVNELISATFTLLRRLCHTALKFTDDEEKSREALTQALFRIMADVMPEKKAA